MEYDTVTLDTQTVEANSFNFDGGLLDQLKQFKDGPTQIVISEIVYREILDHLHSKTEELRTGLLSKAAVALRFGVVDRDAVDSLKLEEIDSKVLARERLETFLRDIGAKIIFAENVEINDLVYRYFSAAPPFAKSGKKKSEFPDAICLISLELWATEHKKRMLVCSEDRDWLAYCSKSERLDIVPSLKEVLPKLQSHLDEAEVLGKTLLNGLIDRAQVDTFSHFFNLLNDEITGLSLYGEVDSFAHAETDQVDLEMLSCNLGESGVIPEFSVTQAGTDKLDIVLDLLVRVRATASFSFAIYDSIDKDYVGIGSSDAQVEEELDVTVLLSFAGDVKAGSAVLSSLELVDGPNSIDFGYVEPDYGDDEFQ